MSGDLMDLVRYTGTMEKPLSLRHLRQLGYEKAVLAWLKNDLELLEDGSIKEHELTDRDQLVFFIDIDTKQPSYDSYDGCYMQYNPQKDCWDC